MEYRQAKKVKPGDTLVVKGKHFLETSVLSVQSDDKAQAIFFHCTDGCFHHTAVMPSVDTSINWWVERYLKSPDTVVFINHNNELGEWLYGIEVRDSNAFWLCSFGTQEEAEEYIRKHNLKVG